MTSREILFDIVESLVDKINSGEYRQLLDELAKMPSGIISKTPKQKQLITPEELDALENAYAAAIARSDQLSKTPFLLRFSESQLFQMGLWDQLTKEDDPNHLDAICMRDRIPEGKYKNGTGFWTRIGSSDYLIIKNTLKALRYEIEALSLGEDKGLRSTYPYSEIDKNRNNNNKSIPFFLVEDDIHYIGRRVCRNVVNKQVQESDNWRLGTSFVFNKYDNELFLLEKMLKFMNYEMSKLYFLGKEGKFFVRTTYPYERYIQELKDYDSKMIPIEVSEKDLVKLGIKRQETVDGGTEFLILDENSFDFHLLHFIMETLGYEVYHDTYSDIDPSKDIRGYGTNYPWSYYKDLEQQ